MRSAHETLDPEAIGEIVASHASTWLRASALAVYAVDMDGQIGLMASREMMASLSAPAAAVGRWVLSHGREFASADLRHDLRVRAAAGAVFGVPLRCRGPRRGRAGR